MKNKKLIATVASLCLIVVAVVAAVVGVLAAASQTVTNKIKVNYTAVPNVYAEVSINGRTELGAYSTAVSQVFNAYDSSTSKELAFEYNSGITLAESGGATNKYALYQFKFENKNDTHALEVALTYTQNSAGSNVTLFWAKSSSATWAPTLEYSAAGELTTSVPLTTDGFEVTPGTTQTPATAVKVYSHDSGAVTTPIAKSGTQYIYLVVAVSNLNNNASYDLDGTSNILSFALAGHKTSA